MFFNVLRVVFVFEKSNCCNLHTSQTGEFPENQFIHDLSDLKTGQYGHFCLPAKPMFCLNLPFRVMVSSDHLSCVNSPNISLVPTIRLASFTSICDSVDLCKRCDNVCDSVF